MTLNGLRNSFLLRVVLNCFSHTGIHIIKQEDLMYVNLFEFFLQLLRVYHSHLLQLWMEECLPSAPAFLYLLLLSRWLNEYLSTCRHFQVNDCQEKERRQKPPIFPYTMHSYMHVSQNNRLEAHTLKSHPLICIP